MRSWELSGGRVRGGSGEVSLGSDDRCKKLVYAKKIRSNLLKFITLHCGYRGIETGHALRRIVPCNIVYLGCIALLVVEMCEMKPIRTISMKLQEPRRNNAVFQIYSLAPNVPFPLQDKPRLVRYDQMILNKLAIENVATISEEREPARHHQCAMPMPRLRKREPFRQGWGDVNRKRSGRRRF